MKMNSRNSVALLAAALASVGLGNIGRAATLVPGNLAVDRVGDGTQTLASTGNTQFIDQFTPLGVLVDSTAIPDSGSGSLIVSGTATSEGSLSRSADGNYLVVAGYNTPRPSSASLTSSTSSNVPRGFGFIDASETYTLAATTNTQFSGNNIRTGATDNGTNVWGGGGNTGTVVYTGNGTTNQTGTVVQSGVTNTRVNRIYGGNLLFSTGSGTPGVYSFTGLPTIAGGSATQIITSPGTSPSPYSFVIDPTGNIAYVADDRSITNGGGIERFDKINGVFTLSYTLGTGTGSTVGARGLTVDFSGATPLVYATTAETSANRLISIIDTGSTSVATLLAAAPTGEVFRGVDFTPTPEPGSIALIGAGGLLMLRRRRAAR